MRSAKRGGGSEKKRGMQSEMRFSQAAAKENGHWAFWRREKNLKIMRSQSVYPPKILASAETRWGANNNPEPVATEGIELALSGGLSDPARVLLPSWSRGCLFWKSQCLSSHDTGGRSASLRTAWPNIDGWRARNLVAWLILNPVPSSASSWREKGGGGSGALASAIRNQV